MSKQNSLLRSPTLLTAILSVATLAGYVAYRFTLGEADTDGTADTGIEVTTISHGDHDHALADSLPDIVLNDLAGTPTSLQSLAGNPLVINFWATWCKPCLEEIPMLKAFHSENASIDVIGIAVDRLDPVLEWAETMDFNYTSLVGQSDGMDAMAAFHNDSGGLPFTVFTTTEGAVLGTRAGELHAEHVGYFAEVIVAGLNSGEFDLDSARVRTSELLEISKAELDEHSAKEILAAHH